MKLKNRSASFSLQFNLAVTRPIPNNNNNRNFVKQHEILRLKENVMWHMRFVLARRVRNESEQVGAS